MAGEVALTGETINVADVYNDARFDRTVDIKTGYRTKSMLCMPILNKSRHTVGVAQLLNKEGGGAFTIQDEQVFASISAHLAVSLTNADLYSEMVKTASPQTHAPCASTHTTVGSGATRARLVASMYLSTCTVVASSPTIPPSPTDPLLPPGAESTRRKAQGGAAGGRAGVVEARAGGVGRRSYWLTIC